MKKILLILFLAQVFVCQNVMASNFKLTKGKQYELCREVAKVLDEPENKDFKVDGKKNSMFSIPDKYKNFSFPKWEDVPLADVPKYIAPGKEYDLIMHPKGYTDIVQKTEVDFDNDGKKDTILHFRQDAENSMWGCYVPDIIPTTMSEGYNKSGGECNLLYYRGRIFIESTAAGSGDVNSFNILQTNASPSNTPGPIYFGTQHVCEFDPK